MTTMIVIAVLIVFAITLISWRIMRALLGPIFGFVYNELLVGGLRRLGISEGAAKALVSVLTIVIIIIIIF